MKKLIKKINIPFFLISLIWYIITFFTDKNIINFSLIHIRKYIFIKIIVFVILVVSFQFLAQAICKKDKTARKYLKYFLIYFIPMLIILLLIWPGVWYGNDVKAFINYAYKSAFFLKLHYLTSVFYSVGLSIFPCLSGAIILQLVYMSVVVSYISKNIFDIFHEKKFCYIIYLPFFLPVTIFYTLYANRPIMFGITYLLVVSIVMFDYLKKKKLSTMKMIVLFFLIALVSNWRSEAIYFVLASPLFIFLVYKIKFNIKNISKVVIPIFLCFLIIRFPQEWYKRNMTEVEKTQRNLPVYVSTLSYMTTYDLKGSNFDNDIEAINKVLNVKSLKKYPSYNNTVCIWQKDSCIRTNYTMEEYKEFQKAFMRIILNNKSYFLETKYLTFWSSTRMEHDNFSAIDLYKNDDDMINNNPTTKTIFGNNIRKTVLQILEGRKSQMEHANVIYTYTNNLLIPLILLVLLFLISIFKRRLLLFLLTGMLLGHAVLVFLTAPACYFMYYYNIFLIGLFLGFYMLIKLVDKKIIK